MPSKLRYIVEGKTLLERLLWALVLTLAAAYTALSISKSLEEARANPIVTSVESVSVQELPFPAVSISHGRSNREQQKSKILSWGKHGVFVHRYLERVLNSIKFDCALEGEDCARETEGVRKQFQVWYTF